MNKLIDQATGAILRRAWFNLVNKHMNTDRINQKDINCVSQYIATDVQTQKIKPIQRCCDLR